MRNRVNELYNQIKQAQEELKSIRKACAHTSTYTSLYSYRVGSYELFALCVDCDEPIRPSTEKEAEEYNQKLSPKEINL